MSAERLVLAGGNGFLGQLLARALLQRECQVDILVRRPVPTLIGDPFTWDGETIGAWAQRLNGATAIVNLAGRSVNCRYTPRNRATIVASRVNSVKAIGEAIQSAAQPPRVWVQASSLALYGEAGDEVCDESRERGTGFSPDVVDAWESAAGLWETPGTRRVILRMGLVFDPSGGALRTFIGLARWGLGGRTGTGGQWVSWLHAADLTEIVARAINDSRMSGAYNVTAPGAVTNATLMRALRRALRRPWEPPAATWMVRVGAWLMRTEPELALVSRRCVPRRLTDEGFSFRYPNLGPALDDLLGGAVHSDAARIG